MRDRLKVRWLAAEPLLAEMVEFVSWWHRTLDAFPLNDVDGTHRAVVPNGAIAV